MLYTIPLTGSSPLTRGARGAIGLPQPLQGLIPAHAGSTGGTNPKPTHPWAHPRSRGEHFPAGIGAGFGPGSSPLTRGARFLSRLGRGCVRLIPAHAGSTTASPLIFILPPAHPRSRGEHAAGASRGRQPPGLIPAHAGSTCWIIHYRGRTRAHPRSRGEHDVSQRALDTDRGSSPLTRGALTSESHVECCNGLIPAHAGSTRTSD